jgi:hypothetical protein
VDESSRVLGEKSPSIGLLFAVSAIMDIGSAKWKKGLTTEI